MAWFGVSRLRKFIIMVGFWIWIQWSCCCCRCCWFHFVAVFCCCYCVTLWKSRCVYLFICDVHLLSSLLFFINKYNSNNNNNYYYYWMFCPHYCASGFVLARFYCWVFLLELTSLRFSLLLICLLLALAIAFFILLLLKFHFVCGNVWN